MLFCVGSGLAIGPISCPRSPPAVYDIHTCKIIVMGRPEGIIYQDRKKNRTIVIEFFFG
jgi:hypothetical protein